MEIVQVVAVAIFVVTFGFIIHDGFHRTVLAFWGAIIMVVAGIIGGFYGPEEAVGAVDYGTIGLLFGMMVIVAILEKTGLFEYLGIKVAKLTKGRPWKLVVYLGILTTLLSLILDNVTTIILIVPITIILTRKLQINPVPILMAEVLLANTGGVATLVGDPPNIMIGSAAGFSFVDFLTHSLPVVFVAWMVTLLTLKFIFREELKEKPKNIEELMKLDERGEIKQPRVLKKMLFILGLVVVMFFVHHHVHIQPAFVAIIGAGLALWAVSSRKDPQEILEKVELSVLLFFVCLFIIVGGMEATGVLDEVARLIVWGAEENLILTAIILLWSTAILSAIVDNIPLTVAMIPIILGMAEAGLPGVNLLWWALVFGVGFGGNGSAIGSTANIIVVSKAEKEGIPISFNTWFKWGTPTMITTLLIATLAIWFFGDLFMG